MSLVNVDFPYQYVPDNDRNRAIASGYIYIGEPDLDPEIIANQKTIYFVQEDGNEVVGAQPIRTSAGGVPTYNGSPVAIKTEGDYSIKILDKNSVQVYYSPNSNVDEALLNALQTVDTLAELPAAADNSGRVYLVAGAGKVRSNGTLWVPIDFEVTPELYGAAADGATDDTTAIQDAIDNHPVIRLTPNTYLVSGAITARDRTIIGSGREATTLEGDGSQDIVLAAGGLSKIENFQIRYSDGVLSGSETVGQKVGFAPYDTDSGTALLKGGSFRDMLISNCGSGVHDFEKDYFSVTWENIQIIDCSYAYFDAIANLKTGNVYSNIYMNGLNTTADRSASTASYSLTKGFWLQYEAECVLNQINIEHCEVETALGMKGVQGFHAGSVHLEGVKPAGTTKKFLQFDCCSGTIGALSFYFTRQNYNDVALIDLLRSTFGNTGWFGGGEVTDNLTSRINIGSMYARGLNRPDSGLYDLIPDDAANKTLQSSSITDVYFVRRDPTYTDENYYCDLSCFNYSTYSTIAFDENDYDEFKVGGSVVMLTNGNPIPNSFDTGADNLIVGSISQYGTTGEDSTPRPMIMNRGGLGTTPTFTWWFDQLTGITHPSVGQVGVVCNNSPSVTFAAGGMSVAEYLFMPPLPSPPASPVDGMFSNSNGSGGGFDGSSGAGLYRYDGASWIFVG